jgi:hypothetical protein
MHPLTDLVPIVNSEFDKELTFSSLDDFLTMYGMVYETIQFPSGGAMIDIRHKDRFIVVQLTDAGIGWSEITEEKTGFTTLSDVSFGNLEAFRSAFARLLQG